MKLNFFHNLFSSSKAGLFLAFSELWMDQIYTQLLGGKHLPGQSAVLISSCTSGCCLQLFDCWQYTHLLCFRTSLTSEKEAISNVLCTEENDIGVNTGFFCAPSNSAVSWFTWKDNCYPVPVLTFYTGSDAAMQKERCITQGKSLISLKKKSLTSQFWKYWFKL